MGLKYDLNLMNHRTIFENITRASVKGCFLRENLLIVIVKENEIGKAIGKNGINIKKMEQKFNKKIKIVEFDSNILRFVQNLINPIKAKEIRMEDGIINISLGGVKEKGQIIGRDSRNLQELKKIVSVYFDIVDIKVL